MAPTSEPRDYFASRLLERVDADNPVALAYEAQAVSREVGFDFNNYEDVVPRALDEVREAEEAHAQGDEGRDAFGDEIADIMFSLINLARHAGIDSEALGTLTGGFVLAGVHPSTDLTVFGATMRRNIADTIPVTDSEQRKVAVEQLFANGMQNSIDLAVAYHFDPIQLLRENVRKYLVRCQTIEELASEESKSWADLAANGEIIAFWKRAKTKLKSQ
jgi:uncharacterized protein YabN with tetrapyrrole methylase and pyrophosphatase domain